MTYSLTGLSSMGSIKKISSNKDSGLFKMPLPATDSTGTILLDIFGAGRSISISGTFTGTEATVASFIVELDGLIVGMQSSRDFVCDKSGVTYHVLVESLSWEGEEGCPTKVDYEINLVEGSA